MRCACCSSPQLELIDFEIMSGQHTFSVISSKFSVSTSSVQRHASGHLQEKLALAEKDKRQAALSLVSNLGSLINEIQEIRSEAGQGTESFRVRLKSIELEGSLLLRISDRLGVDQQVMAALREIKVLASVLGPILRNNPAIAQELGEALRGRGVDALADACLAQAQPGQLSIT